MSSNDILARVRRAVHLADNLCNSDAAAAQQLLASSERCRLAEEEFLAALAQVPAKTTVAEQARAELLEQCTLWSRRDGLLQRLLDREEGGESQIYTRPQSGQVQ